MVFDSNLVIRHIRQQAALPVRAVLLIVVVGEIEAFALKSNWGYQKITFWESYFRKHPIVDITRALVPHYAELDAYSQGKLKLQPLPPGLSARNMGKNDLLIAATAIYFDMELHTADDDFDHLPAFGLKLVKS